MTVDTPTPTPLAPVTVEPLEPTTRITLGERLRLGRLSVPVAFRGGYFGMAPGEACAMGAIAVGFGCKPGLSEAQAGDVLAKAGVPNPVIVAVALKYDNGASDDEIVAFLDEIGL